ncbi:MAG: hypothetical protein ACSLEZ_02185 [Thiobacillus sp.]
MPITFFDAPDGTHVRQSFDSPTVYLDHWAIRLFSEELDLQDRFVDSLLAKAGTLLLSHISFSEFAALSDARHCDQAEAFFERLLPNIYLTDFDFDKLLRKERDEPNNAKRFWPPADLPQLKHFVERAGRQSSRLTMRGFVALTHETRYQISESTKVLKRTLVDEFTAARNEAEYVAKARRIYPSDKRYRTLLILGELMRSFNLDPTAPITENDVIDLLHAAMPVNCCDFALLDGPWAERVEKMRHRVSKTTMEMPIASCFSQRNNGVESFLAELENFDRVARESYAAVP